MRTRTAMTGLVAAACASVLLSPAPAAATQAPEAADVHCVINAVTAKSTCYDTFRESIAAATGGRVTDATQEKAAKNNKFVDTLNTETATARTPGSRAANNLLVVGILFEHMNYEGSSRVIYGLQQCRNDGEWDYTDSNLGRGLAFDNRVSSLQLRENCEGELYSEINFGGTRQFYVRTTPWVGDAMNDQASSIRLT
ncbi:hypothetical protein ABT354_10340 [Streptomyces sp. NPDC000594]|uniref:hypothetical protein n=1 Tax=Streptomyces sp. NPDC000594 TaxID=3154261 RepID=UPI0033230BE4